MKASWLPPWPGGWPESYFQVSSTRSQGLLISREGGASYNCLGSGCKGLKPGKRKFCQHRKCRRGGDEARRPKVQN